MGDHWRDGFRLHTCIRICPMPIFRDGTYVQRLARNPRPNNEFGRVIILFHIVCLRDRGTLIFANAGICASRFIGLPNGVFTIRLVSPNTRIWLLIYSAVMPPDFLRTRFLTERAQAESPARVPEFKWIVG